MSLEQAFFEGLAPDPRISVSECAEKFYVLGLESAIPGEYKIHRTPYMKEPMDSMGVYNPCRQGCTMKSVQSGGTLGCVNAAVMYLIKYAPGPAGLMMPTETLMKRHKKERLQPMFERQPLSDIIIPPSKKSVGSTLFEIRYTGGTLYLLWSGSGVSSRSTPMRYIIIDDLDGCAATILGEGSTPDLLFKRANTFSGKEKISVNSTPTAEESSAIFKLFQGSDQREYTWPCPYCGHYQHYEWGGKDADFGIKFEIDDFDIEKSPVWYECRMCHKKITEDQKTWMQHLDRAKWDKKVPKNTSRRWGWHISGLMAEPGMGASWRKIAGEFVETYKDPERYQIFVNQRLGLPFKTEGQQPEWRKFYDRHAAYDMGTVPNFCKVLTAGVDVHDNRLNVVILGWGAGEECALVWRGELFGSVAESGIWNQLDSILFQKFPHESGVHLTISAAAVDSGDNTQIVYAYTRNHGLAFSIKGARSINAPAFGGVKYMDVDYAGTKIKRGVALYPVGVGSLKKSFYIRVNQVKKPGAKYIHFCKGLDKEFFLQLFSEKLISEWRGTFAEQKWIVSRSDSKKDNHYLDAWVYATAASIRAQVPWINFEEIHIGDVQPVVTRRVPQQKPKKRGSFSSAFGR